VLTLMSSSEMTEKDMVADALACYARIVRLATEKGWDAKDGRTPDVYLSDCLRLAERDLSGIDEARGRRSDGNHRRFYGDRTVRLRTMRTELDNYRSAALAARLVR
jgi:hypothetical protein